MRRYPYWYGFGGFILLAMISVITYWSTHSHAEAKIEPKSDSIKTYSDDEIELTITTFLNDLAGGHVKDAQSYTSGDTYQVLQSNQSQKVSGSLLDHSIQILFENDTFAQVKVDATIQSSAGKDRAHYLYSLYKLNQKWKIFKIEDFPEIYQNGKQDPIAKTIQPMIENYLTTVGKGDWKETSHYLAGTALQDLQKSATFLPKNLSSEVKIISQTPVATTDKSTLMLVEYQVINDMKQNDHLKTLFQVEDVGGEWKITKITNVLMEGGPH